jgi:transposase InsO family protein
MDVTHISEFSRSWFVHVIIHTFSHFISATARTGEMIKDVIVHCLHTFSVIGIPRCIKIDNALAYTSKAFLQFCLCLGISLKTGIPYKPSGSGIVEWAHQKLKIHLSKQKGG